MHKCSRTLTADADKGKLLSKSTALLEVGSVSRGDANPVHVESLSGTRTCDPNRPETLFPPAGESASGRVPSDQYCNLAQMTGNGQTQSGTHRGTVSSPRREASCKKLCLRDTVNGARKYADER